VHERRPDKVSTRSVRTTPSRAAMLRMRTSKPVRTRPNSCSVLRDGGFAAIGGEGHVLVDDVVGHERHRALDVVGAKGGEERFDDGEVGGVAVGPIGHAGSVAGRARLGKPSAARISARSDGPRARAVA
jgi:hypothetical protein